MKKLVAITAPLTLMSGPAFALMTDAPPASQAGTTKPGMREHLERSWTPKDIATLRSFAGKKAVSEIARALRRSHGATTAKAFELRLSLKLPKLPACPSVSRVRAAR